jgi:hypothetical protein
VFLKGERGMQGAPAPSKGTPRLNVADEPEPNASLRDPRFPAMVRRTSLASTGLRPRWSSANITEYTKGPADALRKTEKVNV